MSISEGANLNLRVSFEPHAIREHYEGLDPDPTKDLTDEQLEKIGEYAMLSDQLWVLFHELLVEAFEDVEKGLIDLW